MANIKKHHIEILNHDIVWWANKNKTKKLDDMSIEHITYQISNGVTSGSLPITSGKLKITKSSGWWEIVNWRNIALELYNSYSSARDSVEARKLFNENWG